MFLGIAYYVMVQFFTYIIINFFIEQTTNYLPYIRTQPLRMLVEALKQRNRFDNISISSEACVKRSSRQPKGFSPVMELKTPFLSELWPCWAKEMYIQFCLLKHLRCRWSKIVPERCNISLLCFYPDVTISYARGGVETRRNHSDNISLYRKIFV